jgi:2-dehydro-3-deoxygalactonokinase
MANRYSHFFSGDWGTSRLRLRLVQAEPLTIRAEVVSEAGIARVFAAWQSSGGAGDREGVFLRAMAPVLQGLRAEAGDELRDVPLVLSGMASATIGLRELPYAPTPFDLRAGSLPTARIPPGELPCETVVVSGVCTDDDVLRGEETMLIGLAALGHGDGLYILPGTHSKHVDVRGGAIAGFGTYLTGELFALLREHSVLRPCLAAGAGPDESFVRAVREAREVNLLREMFALRARTILRGTPPEENGQRLSGLLIGTELHALSPEQDAGRPIVVAAAEPLLSYYHAALRCLGFGGRIRLILPGEMALAIARGQLEILARG